MPVHQTYVAGVKFRPGAVEHMATLDQGAEFALQPEPTNQYDPNAVKILHGDRHVGYVPRDLSEEVSQLVAAGRVERVVKRSGSGIEIHFTKGDAE